MAKPKIKKKDPRTVCMKDRNGATMDVIVISDWIEFHKDVIMKDIQFPVYIGLVTDTITKAVYVLMCDYKVQGDDKPIYGIKFADAIEEESKNE